MFEFIRPPASLARPRLNRGLVLLVLACAVVVAAVVASGQAVLDAVAMEDGLFESLTALCFFLAFLTLAFGFWRSKAATGRHRRNVWLALLAGLCLFAAGEEISWGQRLLGFETPEAVKSHNLQKEFTLHNLHVLQGYGDNPEAAKGRIGRFVPSVEKMFSMFWLAYCIGCPLLYGFSGAMRRLLDRFRLPLFPLLIGWMGALNYSAFKALELAGLAPRMSPFQKRCMEMKEFYFSFLFLAFGLAVVLAARLQRPAEAGTAESVVA